MAMYIQNWDLEYCRVRGEPKKETCRQSWLHNKGKTVQELLIFIINVMILCNVFQYPTNHTSTISPSVWDILSSNFYPFSFLNSKCPASSVANVWCLTNAGRVRSPKIKIKVTTGSFRGGGYRVPWFLSSEREEKHLGTGHQKGTL